MLFNRNNFHKKSFCLFRQAEIPNRACDHTSKSGSRYWFDETGVFRASDHWGRAARCKWRLISEGKSSSRTKCGHALWTDFCHDNDTEKLYFIKIIDGKPDYYHRDSPIFSNDHLRTSGETTKRLRQVRQFLQQHDSDTETHGKILVELAATDHPMWKIRASFAASP